MVSEVKLDLKQMTDCIQVSLNLLNHCALKSLVF